MWIRLEMIPTLWIKRLLALSILVVFFLIVSGCAVTKPAAPVTITKYVLVKPTPLLLKDCEYTAVPPDAATYINATSVEQERMLFEYSVALQKDLQSCAARWPILRQWLEDQAKIYPDP